MDERATYGNPATVVGDSQFAALGRYLAAKKDGIEPDPSDWEEITADADADTVSALAEPSAETYKTYGKVYKGFMQEIVHRTLDEAVDGEKRGDALHLQASLWYEIDKTLEKGKTPGKQQLRDFLARHEDELNLPINDTTIGALNSWLKAKLAADRKVKKKRTKLKEAASSLAKSVQVSRDEKGLRRLILREMVGKGRISEELFTELCDSLFLNDEEPESDA